MGTVRHQIVAVHVFTTVLPHNSMTCCLTMKTAACANIALTITIFTLDSHMCITTMECIKISPDKIITVPTQINNNNTATICLIKLLPTKHHHITSMHLRLLQTERTTTTIVLQDKRNTSNKPAA